MNPKIYKVTGCGVSSIGIWSESMLLFCQEIIEKGGVPTITEYQGE